jgi:hypothetical protein
LASTLLLFAHASHAHVRLLAPDGGETLQGGQFFEISWEVVVDHQISGWDLWYSTTGPNGPWIDLARNFPPGDSTIGSIHTFRWTVPLENSADLHVRVKQLTTFGHQWEDTSAAFSVVGRCCDGLAGNIDGDPDDLIDIADLVYLVDAMFTMGEMPSCAHEVDVNGDGVGPDISDLVHFVDYFFSGGASPAACPQ